MIAYLLTPADSPPLPSPLVYISHLVNFHRKKRVFLSDFQWNSIKFLIKFLKISYFFSMKNVKILENIHPWSSHSLGNTPALALAATLFQTTFHCSVKLTHTQPSTLHPPPSTLANNLQEHCYCPSVNAGPTLHCLTPSTIQIMKYGTSSVCFTQHSSIIYVSCC